MPSPTFELRRCERRTCPVDDPIGLPDICEGVSALQCSTAFGPGYRRGEIIVAGCPNSNKHRFLRIKMIEKTAETSAAGNESVVQQRAR